MKTTQILTLGVRDAVKGFILAIITMIISMVYSGINTGAFPQTWIEWKGILIASLGSGLAYLLKNFLTNSNDQLLKKEDPNKQ